MNPTVKELLSQAYDAQDSAAAVDVLEMAKQDPTVQLSSEDLTKLRYVRVNSLSPARLADLLKSSILPAYQIPDFSLATKIKDYIELTENGNDAANVARRTLEILEGSEEVLGTQNITLNGAAVKPSIGNWLSDYLTFTTGADRSTFDELQYINTSPNAKLLDAPHKEILKDLIRLTDYCLNYIAVWDGIEIPDNPAEAFKDFNLVDYIPGLLPENAPSAPPEQEFEAVQQTQPKSAPSRSIASQRSAPQARPAPQQPTPKQSSTPAPQSLAPKPSAPINTPFAIDDFKQAAKPVQAKSLPKQHVIDELSRPKSTKPVMPMDSSHHRPEVANPAKVRELINHSNNSPRGVVHDDTNVKIDEERKRLSKERDQKMKTIANKLADLRKRNNP